ncbi:MAG: hypothetical protein ACYDBO_02145 [Vulcanimicrobiaceae bacterium]
MLRGRMLRSHRFGAGMIALTRKQVAKLARKDPGRLLILKYATGDTIRANAQAVHGMHQAYPKGGPRVFMEDEPWTV